MVLMEILILVVTVATIIVAYAWNKNQFYKRQNVNHLHPKLFFGNMLDVLLGKEHAFDITARAYKLFANNKYVGFFNFLDPVVIIQDIELLKTITIKDFDHFTDHIPFTDEEVDPLLGKILFSLKEERWKEMRSALSPAFTSSKMRGMLPFINKCAENFVDYLDEMIQKSPPNEILEFNTKDLTSRYANDVIATCAFGCQVDSLRDDQNDFYKAAKNFSQFSTYAMFKVFVFFFCPILLRILPVGNNTAEYFQKLVLGSIKMREKEKIIRPDMIHLLMLAKQGSLTDDAKSEKDSQSNESRKKAKWSDDEIVAQALIFLFAGFDSSSTAICGIFHHIAVNADVQSKLQKEIDEHFVDGQLQYSDITKFKYLDMVISESLRLFPPAPINDRQCVKAYQLPPQRENSNISLKLKRGDNIWIPTYIIHRDPKYFEDPEKFIPERFSEENKSKMNPNAYMPFGIGPRICIGSRFALMEIKMLTIHVLSKFEIVVTPKTDVHLKIKPHLFDMVPEKGFWIGLKRRNIAV